MTARKTAPKSTAIDIPTIDPALFDTWDEAAEEDAINAAATFAKVPYIIIEGKRFAGRFPDGRIVTAPLRVTIADLEAAIDAAGGDESAQFDQLIELLKIVGNEADHEYLRSADMVSVIAYSSSFFKVFQRIAGVTMGE